MGANASCSHDCGRQPLIKAAMLEDIPEYCIALVLSYLEPPEICEMARIDRAFRAASSADFIWESKLPSNYRYIFEDLLRLSAAGMPKRDIFSRLCRPISFNGGTKDVWIDKNNAGVCVAISAKGMRITGIDDRRYWNHIPTDESRFQTIAYLQQIWWLEVDGDLEFCFPSGIYSLFFKLQLGKTTKRLGRRFCNAENVHGWDIKPVQFQFKLEDGQQATSRCFLDNLGSWVHYHVGDFVVEDPNSLTKVKFSLTQIDCTHTKGGLCVDSVVICPSSMGKSLDLHYI